MNKLSLIFHEKIDFIDKFLLFFIILMPFALATSIFLADLCGSISGIILIYIFFKRKFRDFRLIKNEIIFFIIFYSLILISLIFSDYFKESFLASFFYFRYFLVSLSIFYLLNKYDFMFELLLYSIFFTLIIVILDSLVQYFFGSNLFGYNWPNRLTGRDLKYITGFFNEEKKLGSYLVRFLPLALISLHFLQNKKKLQLNVLFILLVGIIIFLTSERTALFLYIIIFISYFLITQYKARLIILLILIFGLLFQTNEKLKFKYLNFTLEQLTGGFKNTNKTKPNSENNNYTIKFYSNEHQNLIFTSIMISKENFLLGSGVKSFYHECKNLKKDYFRTRFFNKTNLDLTCSTHPHSTYFQILSDIGILGFLLSIYFLYYITLSFYKVFIRINKTNENHLYYYLINLSILVNIFPLIPSGNIFNNWISIILFYLIGFWLFMKKKIKM